MISLENAIPKSYQDEIEYLLYSRDFPWMMVHEKFKDNSCSLGFSHLALDDGPIMQKGSTASPFCGLLVPIAFKMSEMLGKNIDKILRIRVGLLTPSTSTTQCLDVVNYSDAGDDPHIDFMIPHYTGLYYVSNSDGDTVIYNEKVSSQTYTELARSTPKKGKIFLFDGEHYHSSSKPTNGYARIVITINFTTEE